MPGRTNSGYQLEGIPGAGHMESKTQMFNKLAGRFSTAHEGLAGTRFNRLSSKAPGKKIQPRTAGPSLR
jgi:hypothetical protein